MQDVCTALRTGAHAIRSRGLRVPRAVACRQPLALIAQCLSN